jgi:hypothetical protein
MKTTLVQAEEYLLWLNKSGYYAVQNVRSKRRLHFLKQKCVLGHYHNILPAEDALAGGIESSCSAKPSNPTS